MASLSSTSAAAAMRADRVNPMPLDQVKSQYSLHELVDDIKRIYGQELPNPLEMPAVDSEDEQPPPSLDMISTHLESIAGEAEISGSTSGISVRRLLLASYEHAPMKEGRSILGQIIVSRKTAEQLEHLARSLLYGLFIPFRSLKPKDQIEWSTHLASSELAAETTMPASRRLQGNLRKQLLVRQGLRCCVTDRAEKAPALWKILRTRSSTSSPNVDQPPAGKRPRPSGSSKSWASSLIAVPEHHEDETQIEVSHTLFNLDSGNDPALAMSIAADRTIDPSVRINAARFALDLRRGHEHNTATEAVHIIPLSLNNFTPDQAEHARIIWSYIQMYFAGSAALATLQGDGINGPHNAVLMSRQFHKSFDDMELTFRENEDVPDTYTVEERDPDGGWEVLEKSARLFASEVIQSRTAKIFGFASLDPPIDPPHKDLIKVHYAVVRVLHASGAADVLAAYDDDDDSDTCTLVEVDPILPSSSQSKLKRTGTWLAQQAVVAPLHNDIL